jgi:CheY-like chemotaxis protein
MATSALLRTAAQAAEKARLIQPNFILMDMIMPDMNGAEAAEIILNQQPNCKIVFITGQAASEALLKEKFKDRGYTLIHKPFRPEHILGMLSELGLPASLNK